MPVRSALQLADGMERMAPAKDCSVDIAWDKRIHPTGSESPLAPHMAALILSIFMTSAEIRSSCRWVHQSGIIIPGMLSFLGFISSMAHLQCYDRSATVPLFFKYPASGAPAML